MEPKSKTTNLKTKPKDGFHSWIGTLVEPSKKFESDGKLPNYHLDVDYVFGYNKKDLYYLNEKEIIFASGSIGIIQNIETKQQRYLIGHTNDVISVTLNKERTHIATGQVGLEVIVIVWDLTTLKPVSTIKVGKFQGITSLCFSPDGGKLVGVATDVHRTLFVWDWKAQKLNVSTQFSFPIDKVLFNNSKNNIIVYGEKNINFLTVAKNADTSSLEITKKTGLMGSLPKQPTILSCYPLDSEHSVFGSSEGHIYLFKGVNIIKDLKISAKTPVHSILGYGENSFIIISNNKVIQYQFEKGYDSEPTNVKEIYSITADCKVEPVNLDLLNGLLICGTTSSDIYTSKLDSPDTQGFILKGHDDDINNLWMLSNDNNLFVTISNDKTCQVWSIQDHKQHLELNYQVPITVVSGTTLSNKFIAIGLSDGNLVIYNYQEKKEVKIIKIDSEKLRHLRFSPNDEKLSVCLSNGSINIYNVSNEGNLTLLSVCKGSSAHIGFLDWSSDSKVIQSNSGAYEILYWDVQSGSQIKSANDVKDVEWATWSCLLGFQVKGIWSKGQDGSDINCLSYSSNKLLLVTGDDSNNVNLFKFPANNDHSQKKVYNGYHASHVLSCSFTNDSNYLVTCGGDKTIFIWKVLQD